MIDTHRSDAFSLDQIRQLWTDQAKQHGQSAKASWTDLPVIEMEVRELLNWLSDGDSVLDAGCANGYTSVQLASQKRLRVHGIDYIPDMIHQAKSRLEAMRDVLLGDVTFDEGDVTDLSPLKDQYDKVVVVRVIINLGTWDRQAAGIRECLRVLKPGGRLLLSEATVQGWNRLNVFRREWGLPDIPMPSFNTYLDEDRVAECIAPDAKLIDVVNFASTYYVATRVLKPLLSRNAWAPVNIASPEMEFNRFVSMLPPFGDYGTQKLFVIEKTA